MTDQLPEPPQREPDDKKVELPPATTTSIENSEDVSAGENSLWLNDDDFSSSDESPGPAAAEPPRPPGPGLPETAAWMIGVFLLQIVGSLAAGAILVGIAYSESGSWEDAFKGKTLKRLNDDNLGLVMFVVQAVLLMGTVMAVWFRLGRRRKQELPLRPIAWRHLLVILLAFIPLLVLAVQSSIVVNQAWDIVTEAYPRLKRLDEVSSQDAVKKLSEQLSVGMMVLLIAVCPAIGEELVFRGVIGRGLVARWGLPAGVAMTSIFFAAMHLHPPHVIVLLPLSVFLHVAYLSTRSFWAPMLIHFLNNAFVVLVLALAAANPELMKDGQPEPEFMPGVAFGAAVFIALLLAFLWQTRVQFYRVDGSIWDPGYPTAAAPPADVLAEPYLTEADGREWVLLGVGIVVFLIGVMNPV